MSIKSTMYLKDHHLTCLAGDVSYREAYIIEKNTEVLVRVIHKMPREQREDIVIPARVNALVTPQISYRVTNENDIESIWLWANHQYNTKKYPNAMDMVWDVWFNKGVKERAAIQLWDPFRFYVSHKNLTFRKPCEK